MFGLNAEVFSSCKLSKNFLTTFYYETNFLLTRLKNAKIQRCFRICTWCLSTEYFDAEQWSKNSIYSSISRRLISGNKLTLIASTASLCVELSSDLPAHDIILSPTFNSAFLGAHFDIIIGRLCSLPPLIEIPNPDDADRAMVTFLWGERFSNDSRQNSISLLRITILP